MYDLRQPDLTSPCADARNFSCRGECGHLTKQAQSGRWFLTMGHAGFNSPANNGRGYETKAKAEAAHRRYSGK